MQHAMIRKIAIALTLLPMLAGPAFAETGVRIARKHISWYTRGLVGSAAFRHMMNQLPTIDLQRQAVNDFFLALAEHNEHLPYVNSDPAAATLATGNCEDLAA